MQSLPKRAPRTRRGEPKQILGATKGRNRKLPTRVRSKILFLCNIENDRAISGILRIRQQAVWFTASMDKMTNPRSRGRSATRPGVQQKSGRTRIDPKGRLTSPFGTQISMSHTRLLPIFIRNRRCRVPLKGNQTVVRRGKRDSHRGPPRTPTGVNRHDRGT